MPDRLIAELRLPEDDMQNLFSLSLFLTLFLALQQWGKLSIPHLSPPVTCFSSRVSTLRGFSQTALAGLASGSVTQEVIVMGPGQQMSASVSICVIVSSCDADLRLLPRIRLIHASHQEQATESEATGSNLKLVGLNQGYRNLKSWSYG